MTFFTYTETGEKGAAADVLVLLECDTLCSAFSSPMLSWLEATIFQNNSAA